MSDEFDPPVPSVAALRARIAAGKPGGHSIAPKPLTPEELVASRLPVYPDDVQRPKTRGECAGGPRPCPFVSCSYNLYLDVHGGGSIVIAFPNLDPHEMTESCVLDVADRAGETLERVGRYVGVTRERIRQIEELALRKIAKLADSSDRPIDRHHSPLGEAQVG